jgi:two-component system NarL family sensor kinase
VTPAGWQLLSAVLVRNAVQLDHVLEELTSTLDSDGALLTTVLPGGSVLQVTACWPAVSAHAAASLRIPVGYGVIGRVAAHGQVAVLDQDSPRDPVHREVLGLSDGESVARLCLPLTGTQGEVIGVLSLHRSPARPFGEPDQTMGAVLAAALGLRIAADALGAQARASTTQRDELIAQAISAQETERRRIAGDLHDGVTQALVSLDYHLSAASAYLDAGLPSEAAGEIGSARRLSGLAYDETRAAISGLHSLILDDLGLVAALESLAQTVTTSSGVLVSFRCEPDRSLDELPDHAAAALYRIAQEALNNAAKHAEASLAVVTLRRAGDAVVLAVSDDGVGFDAQKVRARSLSKGDAEHYGLSSIAERCALIGAALRIDSVEGRGTAVIVELEV